MLRWCAVGGGGGGRSSINIQADRALCSLEKSPASVKTLISYTYTHTTARKKRARIKYA